MRLYKKPWTGRKKYRHLAFGATKPCKAITGFCLIIKIPALAVHHRAGIFIRTEASSYDSFTHDLHAILFLLWKRGIYVQRFIVSKYYHSGFCSGRLFYVFYLRVINGNIFRITALAVEGRYGSRFK